MSKLFDALLNSGNEEICRNLDFRETDRSQAEHEQQGNSEISVDTRKMPNVEKNNDVSVELNKISKLTGKPKNSGNQWNKKQSRSELKSFSVERIDRNLICLLKPYSFEAERFKTVEIADLVSRNREKFRNP